MHNVLKFLNKSFGVYNIKGIYVEPTYWMAGVIVILIFLLLFTVARVRYLYVHWNLSRTSVSFLFYGFLFALILESFMILGGRTIFTEILGWKNAPKPFSTALALGREKLVNVLGVTEEIPTSAAKENSTSESIIFEFQTLDQIQMNEVRKFVCEP